MDAKSEQRILRKFGVKPCSLILTPLKLFKIRIGCSVTSEKGEKLEFDLTQEETNTFRIRLKRKMSDDEIDIPKRQTKRRKIEIVRDAATKKRSDEVNCLKRQEVNLSEDLLQQNDTVDEKQRNKIENIAARLRPKTVKTVEKQPKKKKPTTVATIGSKAKPKPLDEVQIGEVVLCKMKGYCEWPAIVTGFEKKLIVIEFFGDHTSYKTAIGNFFSFEESHELISYNLRTKKTTLYAKAVREAEICLGIPKIHSIVANSL